jgi:hypothetical protein
VRGSSKTITTRSVLHLLIRLTILSQYFTANYHTIPIFALLSMVDKAREILWQLVDPRLRPAWISELAGILPLSALIDFVDTPRALHVFQLRGKLPSWCWLVTPSGSRILLHSDSNAAGCCLDLDKAGRAPMCLDGRFGDKYPMANAETVRMCLEATKCEPVKVDAKDKERFKEEAGRRPQSLEIVTVKEDESTSTSFMEPRKKRKEWWWYNTCRVIGWILCVGLVACSGMMKCWLALIFLVVVVLTGWNVHQIHSAQPRKLGERAEPSKYNRLVITADHENASNWRAFYGRSHVVNSLLNWPIVSESSQQPSRWLFLSLRTLILAQWITVVGAASMKGWDAYIIAFWILLCIVLISHVFAAERDAKQWLADNAGVHLKRYEVKLSSRRALLNTLMALNPDTLQDNVQVKGHAEILTESADDLEDRPQDDSPDEPKNGGSQGNRTDGVASEKSLRADGVRWIDPILRKGEDRTKWEEATCRAMSYEIDTENFVKFAEDYRDPKRFYWWRFIKEGIEIAGKIEKEAGISGHEEVTG